VKPAVLFVFCGTTEQLGEKVASSFVNSRKHTSGSKGHDAFARLMPGMNPRHTDRMGFSPSCEVVPWRFLLPAASFCAACEARGFIGLRDD